MIFASAWSSATDVATAVVGVLVVLLLRAVFDLRDRVARLEGRLNGERRRDV